MTSLKDGDFQHSSALAQSSNEITIFKSLSVGSVKLHRAYSAHIPQSTQVSASCNARYFKYRSIVDNSLLALSFDANEPLQNRLG